MQTFKILVGKHFQVSKDKSGPGKLGKPITDKKTGKITGWNKGFAAKMLRIDRETGEQKEFFSEGFTAEDQFIPSEVDLVKKFNAPNCLKFEKVDPREPALA